MQSTVKLTKENQKKLQLKSNKTGMKPDDIVNEIISENIDDYGEEELLADCFKELIDIM